MSLIYDKALEFKRKYPLTVAWRIKEHCKIIEKYLFDDETVKYVFLAQKNNGSLDFVNTNVIVLTNKRIMIATKRVLFGYFFIAITPDMFNDITVKKNLIWGSVIIDTVKEVVTLTNISPKALSEINKYVSDTMMKAKIEFGLNQKKKE